MQRIHKKLFQITDRLHELEDEERRVREELDLHRSIDQDAQMDAAVGNYIDREEAGLTAADVRRFEKSLDSIQSRRERLEARRATLLAKLDTGG
jgi:hypothetical protein